MELQAEKERYCNLNEELSTLKDEEEMISNDIEERQTEYE